VSKQQGKKRAKRKLLLTDNWGDVPTKVGKGFRWLKLGACKSKPERLNEGFWGAPNHRKERKKTDEKKNSQKNKEREEGEK